jgi:hypothetical protein
MGQAPMAGMGRFPFLGQCVTRIASSISEVSDLFCSRARRSRISLVLALGRKVMIRLLALGFVGVLIC